MDDLVERLRALYVWPQSIADHYADTLTPRQIEKLYEVGNVAEQAAARITELETSLAEAMATRVDKARAWDACIEARNDERAKVIAEVVAWLRTENGQCDCFARSEGECACGAWDDHKTKPLLEIATALETGEWKK